MEVERIKSVYGNVLFYRSILINSWTATVYDQHHPCPVIGTNYQHIVIVLTEV